jgi:D-amino-acid oxidase
MPAERPRHDAGLAFAVSLWITLRGSDMRVRVLGAGVIGLTSAHALASAGHEVEIWADSIGEDTGSKVAAAIWHVFLVPADERVGRWAQETLHRLIQLATGSPESGVSMMRGVEFLRDTQAGRPVFAWKRLVPYFAWLDRDSLPSGVSDAYEVDVPLADMAVFLPWLEHRVRALASDVRITRVEDMEETGAGVDAVVNCSGLSAGALARDRTVYPLWGQIVRVAKPDGLDRFIGDDDNPAGMAYVIPRTHDVVLGGTATLDAEGSDISDTATDAILSRCSALIPAISTSHVLEVCVGARPCRQGGVRLEVERLRSGTPLIHNYGHGGSGVTLSIGCALEVTSLVNQIRDR